MTYYVEEIEIMPEIFSVIFNVICIAALKLLCDPCNVPAMLNCAHGKDRTGIVSALALSCVGLSKESIADDYALSEVWFLLNY